MSFEMKAEMKRGINPDSGPGNLALGYPHLHPMLPKTEGRKKGKCPGEGHETSHGLQPWFLFGIFDEICWGGAGGGHSR